MLNEIFGALQTREARYWRDKSRREVDFVLPARRGHAIAVEAKWSADAFNGRGLLAFRQRYPEGTNLVVAHDVVPAFTRDWQGLPLRFVNLAKLPSALQVARLRLRSGPCPGFGEAAPRALLAAWLER